MFGGLDTGPIVSAREYLVRVFFWKTSMISISAQNCSGVSVPGPKVSDSVYLIRSMFWKGSSFRFFFRGGFSAAIEGRLAPVTLCLVTYYGINLKALKNYSELIR